MSHRKHDSRQSGVGEGTGLFRPEPSDGHPSDGRRLSHDPGPELSDPTSAVTRSGLGRSPLLIGALKDALHRRSEFGHEGDLSWDSVPALSQIAGRNPGTPVVTPAIADPPFKGSAHKAGGSTDEVGVSRSLLGNLLSVDRNLADPVSPDSEPPAELPTRSGIGSTGGYRMDEVPLRSGAPAIDPSTETATRGADASSGPSGAGDPLSVAAGFAAIVPDLSPVWTGIDPSASSPTGSESARSGIRLGALRPSATFFGGLSAVSSVDSYGRDRTDPLMGGDRHRA
jgi:hypothetical protein